MGACRKPLLESNGSCVEESTHCQRSRFPGQPPAGERSTRFGQRIGSARCRVRRTTTPVVAAEASPHPVALVLSVSVISRGWQRAAGWRPQACRHDHLHPIPSQGWRAWIEHLRPLPCGKTCRCLLERKSVHRTHRASPDRVPPGPQAKRPRGSPRRRCVQASSRAGRNCTSPACRSQTDGGSTSHLTHDAAQPVGCSVGRLSRNSFWFFADIPQTSREGNTKPFDRSIQRGRTVRLRYESPLP